MATNSNNQQDYSSQFSLKHRLIGAGILISFGIIILPWMLGSYSSGNDNASQEINKPESKPSSIATLAANAASKTSIKLENAGSNENRVGDDSVVDNTEVKKFISKVQPIESAKESVKKNSAPKESKPEVSKKTDDVKKEASKTTIKKPKTVEKQVKKNVVSKPVSSPKNTEINRGYIVSIGVFGDVKNVEKMVIDLKSKDFKPSVQKETFNKKDVSRIYMGPYNTRAEAGKIKLRLAEKGIGKTLIKTFP